MIILSRYSEIGLKSTPVRTKFENRLKENMLAMLAYDGIEALVTKRGARMYIESSDMDGAIASLRKVFGIASLSIAETCPSKMEDICELAARYSRDMINPGQSFAVRARREGNEHPFTSMEIGKEAGSAIFLANEGLKVDLTDPDVVFYIEVRNNMAYIFNSYVRCHAGLPLGSQGKVIAEVDDVRGIVSAWLMMKRGCRTYVRTSIDVSLLKGYDPNLKVIDGDDVPNNILGIVKGTSFDNTEGLDVTSTDLPVYFPTIGMTDERVNEIYEILKKENGYPFKRMG